MTDLGAEAVRYALATASKRLQKSVMFVHSHRIVAENMTDLGAEAVRFALATSSKRLPKSVMFVHSHRIVAENMTDLGAEAVRYTGNIVKAPSETAQILGSCLSILIIW